MDREKQKVEFYKKSYPQGTKVVLDHMDGEPHMPSGLKGDVYCVDDMGQIHVQWENGSTLALVPEVDRFHKAEEPKKEKGAPIR